MTTEFLKTEQLRDSLWRISFDKKFKNKEINLFEAFSGLGSQFQALKNIWFNVKTVWISDWYLDAILAYAVNHLKIKAKKIDRAETIEFLKNFSLSSNSKKQIKSYAHFSDEKLSIIKEVIDRFWNLNIKNITWKSLINKKIDLFTYSFPCQEISQQWTQKWFSKNNDTRSGLLREIERVLEEIYLEDKTKLPKVLMMENVKAIKNFCFKNDLDLWIKKLERLWYKSTDIFVVNSSDLW